MKTLASAVVISMLAAGSALAADLSLPVARAPVAAGYDWSGLYVGAHVGGGWETSTFVDPSTPLIFQACCISGTAVSGGGVPTDARSSAFLGGLQGGWMYQIGRLVVGGDFDFSWTRLNANGTASYTMFNAAGIVPIVPGIVGVESYGVSTKWTGTATTTIGVARNNWLFYSKFGAAWAHQDYTLGFTGNGISLFPFVPVPFAFAPGGVSDRVVGWTIGTGVKWAITTNWFLNVEYDYMDFGSKAQHFTATCTAPATAAGLGPCLAGIPGTIIQGSTFNPTFNSHISQVKVGLNYKFPSGFLFW